MGARVPSGWPGSQTGVSCGGRTRLTEPWGVSSPLLDPYLPFWSRWLDLGRASKGPGEGTGMSGGLLKGSKQ